MPLPTKKKPRAENLEDYTILICGEKNAGKTGFAAQFPNHFIFEMEPGNAKHLEATYEDIPDLATFDKYLKMAEDKPEPRTIVVDEIQRLYNLIFQRLLDEEGIDDPKDIGYGKGWKRINDQFDRYVTRLQSLPGGNIYTAHCDWKEIETRTGRKVTKLIPKFGAECTRFKDKWCHICGMIMFTKKGNREFILQGDDLIEASCKLLDHHFKYEGKSITKFPMGASATDAHSNFLSAFGNTLEVAEEDYVKVEKLVKSKPKTQRKAQPKIAPTPSGFNFG